MEDSQNPLERRWEFDNLCVLNGVLWKQAHFLWIIFNRFWRVVPQLKADLENLWSHSTSMLWRESCRMILVRRVFHRLLVSSNFGKRWKSERNNTCTRDRMDMSHEEYVRVYKKITKTHKRQEGTCWLFTKCARATFGTTEEKLRARLLSGIWTRVFRAASLSPPFIIFF